MMKTVRKSLIVDDQPLVRAILKEMLLHMGCFDEVEEAKDGQEAWEIMQLRSFDVVVCDIDMPRLNGIELLRRCHETGSSAAFLMVTGFPTYELKQAALQLGARKFIPKPFSFSLLKESIRNILEPACADTPIPLMAEAALT